MGGIRARRIATLLPSSNSGLSTCLLSSLCCARMASARKAPHILTATNHVTLGHVQALFEEVLSATPKDPGKRAAATRVLRVEAAEWDDHESTRVRNVSVHATKTDRTTLSAAATAGQTSQVEGVGGEALQELLHEALGAALTAESSRPAPHTVERVVSAIENGSCRDNPAGVSHPAAALGYRPVKQPAAKAPSTFTENSRKISALQWLRAEEARSSESMEEDEAEDARTPGVVFNAAGVFHSSVSAGRSSDHISDAQLKEDSAAMHAARQETFMHTIRTAMLVQKAKGQLMKGLKPQRRPLPGMPIPGSLKTALAAGTPDDARAHEVFRDAILLFFANDHVNRVFIALVVVMVFTVLTFGFIIFWAFLGLFLGVDNGWTTPKDVCIDAWRAQHGNTTDLPASEVPRNVNGSYVADDCNLNQCTPRARTIAVKRNLIESRSVCNRVVQHVREGVRLTLLVHQLPTHPVATYHPRPSLLLASAVRRGPRPVRAANASALLQHRQVDAAAHLGRTEFGVGLPLCLRRCAFRISVVHPGANYARVAAAELNVCPLNHLPSVGGARAIVGGGGLDRAPPG